MTEPGALEPDGSRTTGTLSTVPPAPVIKSDEWGDWPQLLIETRHLSIGWQKRPEKKGGACYLVGRTSALPGGTKVVERFAFTPDGWAKAWRFLMRNDADLAGQIRAELTARAQAESARKALERLDESALVGLIAVAFLGGFAPENVFAVGHRYDVRFFGDRLAITGSRSTEPLVEVPYHDVQVLEVGGPGVVSRMSREQQAGITLALGLVGAAIAFTDTKIQTMVRIQSPDSELHFLCTTMTPDALRVQLSRPLGAIRDAQDAKTRATSQSPGGAVAAVAELSRLASLLDSGHLTQEEFDRLKAQLLADS
jgi:hypothetical protein